LAFLVGASYTVERWVSSTTSSIILPTTNVGLYDSARSLLYERQRGVKSTSVDSFSSLASTTQSASRDEATLAPPLSACSSQTQYAKPFFQQAEGREIVRRYYEEQQRLRKSLNRGEVLRLLLEGARETDKLLLTLQVGGHDGKTGDPIYAALVQNNGNHRLTNWLPVVVEPVLENYEKLIQTYDSIDKTRHLPCQLPVRWAMSYDGERNNGGDGACPFYRFNNEPSAPSICREKPYVSFYC
jgi:hypothetical protein